MRIRSSSASWLSSSAALAFISALASDSCCWLTSAPAGATVVNINEAATRIVMNLRTDTLLEVTPLNNIRDRPRPTLADDRGLVAGGSNSAQAQDDRVWVGRGVAISARVPAQMEMRHRRVTGVTHVAHPLSGLHSHPAAERSEVRAEMGVIPQIP